MSVDVLQLIFYIGASEVMRNIFLFNSEIPYLQFETYTYKVVDKTCV